MRSNIHSRPPCRFHQGSGPPTTLGKSQYVASLSLPYTYLSQTTFRYHANRTNAFPDKPSYMATDITRWARDYDIPWTPGWPANYPSKSTTLKVQRFLTACSKECPQQYPKIITALYYAFWFDKKAVQLPEVYEPIATYTLGEEVTNTIIKRVSLITHLPP